MCELRKFSVILTSDVLNLNGELVAYLRTPETYQLSRNKENALPATSYEVDVEGLLPQFGILGKVTGEDMRKHHLSLGKDGKVYLCAFELTERTLVPTIKFWLAHQVLVEEFGIDIMAINSELSGDGDFFERARALKQKDSSLSITNIVLRVCSATIEVVECT